jgi:hypothetical protein
MKNRMKLALCGLAVSALTMGTTFAAPGEGGQKQGKGQRMTPAERFAVMDADGSGDVTVGEFTTAHAERVAKMKERMGDRQRPEGRTPPAPEKIFERMDENGDGVLTVDEIKDRGPRRPGMRGKGEKGGKKGPPADE